jgi:hypothetical protein
LQEYGIVVRRMLPAPAATAVYELTPRARDEVLPVLNALGRFGAFLFESAPDGPIEGVLEQPRRNGHWALAKGVDFEATHRFKLGAHDVGLVVDPTTFEPTGTPPRRPTATIEFDPVTTTRMFNRGLSVREAQADGKLKIRGNREAALALLGRLSLGPLAVG